MEASLFPRTESAKENKTCFCVFCHFNIKISSVDVDHSTLVDVFFLFKNRYFISEFHNY